MSALEKALIIDFESSGLDEKMDLHPESWPTELAWADPVTNAIESSLILPDASWTHWNDAAEQLTGISRAMLAKDGRPAAEVLARLAAASEGRVLYCTAPRFDGHWLGQLLAASGLQARFRVANIIDLLAELSEEAIAPASNARDILLVDAQRWNLIARAQKYAADHAPKTHRAADDVRNLLAMIDFVATNGQPVLKTT